MKNIILAIFILALSSTLMASDNANNDKDETQPPTTQWYYENTSYCVIDDGVVLYYDEFNDTWRNYQTSPIDPVSCRIKKPLTAADFCG